MNNPFLPKHPFPFLKKVLSRVPSSRLVFSTIFLSFGQSLYILLPGLLGVLINQILVEQVSSVFWLFIFPITWFFSIAFTSFGKILTSLATQDVRKITKELTFAHILALPNLIYVDRDAGEVDHLLQELSFSARYVINENIPFFIRTLMTILISFLVISYDSIGLAMLFLSWSVFYIPLSYFCAKKSVKGVALSIESAAKVSASVVEVVQNHELIPAFGTEEYERTRFRKILDQEQTAFNQAQTRIDLYETFLRLLQTVLPFSLVIYLLFTQNHTTMPLGTLVAVFTMSLILTNQIGDFGKGILAFFEMIERMNTTLHKLADTTAVYKEKVCHQTIKTIPNWGFSLNHVWFMYEKQSPVLNDVHITIRENEKVGIIGFSGAGKTTLLKLLKGSLVPSQGEVFLGGYTLQSIDTKCLAEGIAEVSQSIPLFHRSVRENVSYGWDHVSDSTIWDVLEKAHIAAHIKKLPYGLDTVIGVRGQKLSGGERARICIARAFIRNAKVILLDEATSSLDSESEEMVQRGLEELSKGRTVIAIAHRLSTLRRVDRLLLLDQGKVIADGSHDELILKSPLYRSLWNAQFAQIAIV